MNALKSIHLVVGNVDIEMSISVGLCELTHEINPEEMINHADKLMYDMKKRKL